jgi:hypothetical protein
LPESFSTELTVINNGGGRQRGGPTGGTSVSVPVKWRR